MKLKAFIKVMLKGLVREWKVTVFTFIIFPVVTSLLYGYFQEDLFTPENIMSKFYINIIDKDKSQTSIGLKELFNSESLKDFIVVTEDKEKLQAEVVIPKGYESALTDLKEEEIVVKQLTEKGEPAIVAVSSIIDKYNKAMQERILINDKIVKSSLSTEGKEELRMDIVEKFKSFQTEKSIKTNIYTEGKSLTSFQYYSISIFSFISLVLIGSLTTSYYTERENGLVKRYLAAPMSKIQFFNYTLISNFIFAFIVNSLYVMIYKVSNVSFQGAYGILILILIILSILEATLAGFLVAFFKDKRIGGVFMQAFILLSVSVGGAFFPVDKVGGKIIAVLSNIAPNTHIIKVFKAYMLENTMSSIFNPLMIMVIIAIMSYLISIIKVKVKWED